MTDTASFIELLRQRLAERRRHRGEVVLSEAEVQTAVAMLEASGSHAEIEHLQVELKGAQDAWYGRCQVIDERDAEIKRLHDLLDRTETEFVEARAEIGQLRGAAALIEQEDRLQAELRQPKKPKAIKQQS